MGSVGNDGGLVAARLAAESAVHLCCGDEAIPSQGNMPHIVGRHISRRPDDASCLGWLWQARNKTPPSMLGSSIPATSKVLSSGIGTMLNLCVPPVHTPGGTWST